MSALEVRDLRKHFGGLHVINGVSLTIEPGARHALIGPNGAGKTTLVSLLSGALRADSGSVELFGHDVTKAPAHQRVKFGLARTFQVNSLFPALTVLENVLLAVGEARGASTRMWRATADRQDLIDEAMGCLDSVGLAPLAQRRVSQLPYGPQRLVEIAIALALRPKVLLLDEPAAGIPAADSSRLLDIIEKLPADIAVVMIEHDMHVVRRFAREATVLVSGAVLMSGSPADVLGSAEVRRVYLGKDRGPTHGAAHA